MIYFAFAQSKYIYPWWDVSGIPRNKLFFAVFIHAVKLINIIIIMYINNEI